MKIQIAAAAAVVALAGSVASAQSVLQFDLNSLGIQVRDAGGNESAFSGVTHTGSVNLFSRSSSVLNEVSIDFGNGFEDQNYDGTLVSMAGTINLVNGVVTGGSLRWESTSGSGGGSNDWFEADIAANSGVVKTTAIGGFTIDGKLFNGALSDALFANVDVARWFDIQNIGNNLRGSFLQFNFRPNAAGSGGADIDAFVIVPLPGAGLAGLAGLGAIMGVGAFRRRR